MGVGPENTPEPSLFDRIANELATADDNAADATAELPRPVRSRAVEVDADVSGALVLAPSWPAPDISTQIERPLAADRQCSRSGCSNAAAVTLSYHYATSQVWIDRLWPERDPHMYDMCDQHASRLSVPRGWHLEDRRGARRNSLIAV